VGPQLVDGDLAVHRVIDAVVGVRSDFSYLRAEVGDRGLHVQVGNAPEDGDWIRCGDLVGDPDWLEAVIRATGLRLGTDDPVVAASLFVQNYSYRVLTLAIACLTTSGVVPDSSASSMSIALTGGRPSTVCYTNPMALVSSEQGGAIATVLQEPETISDVFEFVIASGLDEHIAVLIDSTRARIRVGARLLWGNVAASSAVAFRTMEGCLGPWVQPLGERFFDLCPVELKGLGSFLALEHAGHRGWYWERTNCCLHDRLPGNIRCGDCSRTPTEERRSAYISSLQNLQGTAGCVRT
jgi:ferric iron reductase protein FhuF